MHVRSSGPKGRASLQGRVEKGSTPQAALFSSPESCVRAFAVLTLHLECGFLNSASLLWGGGFSSECCLGC